MTLDRKELELRLEETTRDLAAARARIAELEALANAGSRASQDLARFKKLVESGADVAVVLNREGGTEYRSPASERMSGLPVEEDDPKGAPAFARTHPDDVDAVRVAFRRVVAAGPDGVVSVTFRRKHVAGHWMHVEALARNLLHDPDVRGVLVNVRDVSDRMSVEQELREIQARHEFALGASQSGLWQLDLEKQTMLWSGHILSILGYDEAKTDPTAAFFLDILHPDDRPLIEGGIARHIANDEPFEFEERLRARSGEYLWFRAVGQVERDENGKPVRIVGHTGLIHERKLAELALRDSERLFRGLFEGTSLAVTLRDLEDMRLVDCNASALRMYGCANIEELKGQKPYDAAPERQPDGRLSTDIFHEVIQRAIRDGSVRQEWIARRKNGELFATEIRATVIELEGRRLLQAVVDDISDRKRAEEGRSRAELLLRESESRYRALIERSRDAIFTIDLTSRVLFASPATTDVFGYSPNEFLAADLPAQIVMEESRSALLALRETMASSKNVLGAPSEWAWRHKDGRTVYTENMFAAIHDANGETVGVQVIARDVTDRRRGEVARRTRAARDALLSKVSRRFLNEDPEAAIQASLELVGATLGAERVAVLALDETERHLAISHRHFVPGAEPAPAPVAVSDVPPGLFTRIDGWRGEEALVGAAEVAEARVKEWLAGLGERPELIYAPIGYAGRIFGLLGALAPKSGAFTDEDAVTLRTVSELIAVGQVRRAAEKALAKAKEEAVAASLMKSAFLANMSHELRTPLNGVIGMVDLLGTTPLDERQRRYAHVARASANLLLSAINDILDFSKIEAGKLEIDEIEFTPSDLIEEVVSIFGVSAEEKGLELCCECPGLGDTFIGAPARIRQVLVNLVSNAIKFTHSGEVMVRASALEDGSGAQMRLEVTDSGIGIAAAAQSKLFQPFSQVDASTTREYGGTGLGLAISRELVERMGGEIGVVSAEGAGATFWFTLRLRRPDRIVDEARPDGRLVGARVLCVDDNATNRDLLRDHLTAVGMICETAPDGLSALAMLVDAAERRKPYHLAILDHHMPGMDGRDLARRVTSDPRIRGTRLVMLGSMVRPLDPAEQRELGIARYGTKPIWRAELLRIVSAVLSDVPPEPRDAQPSSSIPAGRYADAPLILLVEDSPINAEVAGEILKSAGYAFDLVTDGIRAVEATLRRPYDLILMDCQLPELDGYDATRRIRDLEAAGRVPGSPTRIPIIALTASATPGDLERCLAAGMDEHIPKPVDGRKLLRAIASRLAIKSAVRASRNAHGSEGERVVARLGNALERLQGNQSLLRRIIAQFTDAARQTMDDLRSLVTKRDGHATAFAAHRLRGQAASFDAEALIVQVEALEDAAKSEDWPLAVTTLPLLEREIDRLLEAISIDA